MLRLRTEGIVAAAGASDFLFNDPNFGFAGRGAEFVNETTGDPHLSGAISRKNAFIASAKLAAAGSGNISDANQLFENYIASLESSHPGSSSTENAPWMLTYFRWKNAGLDPAKYNRFRNVQLQWNTRAALSTLSSGGWTQDHQHWNALTGTLAGEEWAGVNSAADSRYAWFRDVYWPQNGERFFKQGMHMYNSPTYGRSFALIYDAISRYSTHATTASIGRFLRDQWFITNAHLFALGQFCGAASRCLMNVIGTPRYAQTWEQVLWLLFGGDEQPFLIHEGSNEHPWAEGSWEGVGFAAIPGFAMPDVIWRINQAARQQTHTFKQKEREEPAFTAGTPNVRWPVTETYTRAPARYAVTTTHFPNNYDYDAVAGSANAGQFMKWAIVWKSSGSQLSMFRVGQNDNDTMFGDGSSWQIPIDTHRATCFGGDGVVVEVYNLPSGQTKPFIEGYQPDQIQAESTSGNWKILHMGTCMIACYWTAGFSQQSPKLVWRYPGSDPRKPNISRAWYRSPGTGSATKLGVVVETAAPEDYAGGNPATQLSNFAAAVTASRGGFPGGVDASQIGASQPRIRYFALNGKTYICEYMGLKSIDGVPFDWDNAKRLESPWVSLDYGGDEMFVTDPGTGQVTRYRWSDKSITQL